ncbi:MAG: Ig-like domain-containing protein [Clostridiales bacterium]|nr:Ig-like domain-containing protein [Clostridiales bacterium]
MSATGSASATLVVSPTGATNKALSWSSSNPLIASVADTDNEYGGTATITAVAAGTCTVTATAADGSGTSKEIAVTVYDDEKEVFMTPADLEPITQIARNRLPGANFTDNDFPIVGREYGVGWTFAYGSDQRWATWEGVTDNTIPTESVSSEIRITNNGGGSAQNDALTYSYLHGLVGNNDDTVNEVREEGKIFYFSSMVKVSTPTWFSVTIGYSPTCALGNHYEGTPYYDLGRKFLVTPEMGWTEIGQADGKYLPFRTNGSNSNDAAPSAGNAASASTGANYANEERGNVLFNLPGAPGTNDLNYGFVRIWAYGASALTGGAEGNGAGVPNGAGFAAGDYYDLTAARFWSHDSIPPAVITDVESVTVNKSELQLEVGKKETLTAQVLPADASYPDVYWTSSNTAVATVNAFTGEVTAIKAGTAVIKAEADSVSGTCTVTVVEESVAVDKSALQTKYDAVKDTQKGNYSDQTWDVFSAALTAAKSVLDKEDALQTEVDLALTALNAAHEGLDADGRGCGSSAAAGSAAVGLLLLPLAGLFLRKKKEY